MRDITTDMILNWIEQCDNQLRQLQKAKYFIHREYYDKDSIGYSTEEDMRDYFSNLIREHKTKKELLERMLIQCETENNVEMFDYVFDERIVNKLPENLRKEFYDFVYEM